MKLRNLPLLIFVFFIGLATPTFAQFSSIDTIVLTNVSRNITLGHKMLTKVVGDSLYYFHGEKGYNYLNILDLNKGNSKVSEVQFSSNLEYFYYDDFTVNIKRNELIAIVGSSVEIYDLLTHKLKYNQSFDGLKKGSLTTVMANQKNIFLVYEEAKKQKILKLDTKGNLLKTMVLPKSRQLHSTINSECVTFDGNHIILPLSDEQGLVFISINEALEVTDTLDQINTVLPEISAKNETHFQPLRINTDTVLGKKQIIINRDRVYLQLNHVQFVGENQLVSHWSFMDTVTDHHLEYVFVLERENEDWKLTDYFMDDNYSRVLDYTMAPGHYHTVKHWYLKDRVVQFNEGNPTYPLNKTADKHPVENPKPEDYAWTVWICNLK